MSQNPDEFDDRVAKARVALGEPSPAGPDSDEDPGIGGAMGFGMRAGAQFVAAVVVGGLIGWAIDRWLGTRPFGMLIVMVLCFVAAMANVWLMMTRAVNAATDASQGGVEPAKAAERDTDEVDGESA